MSEDLKNLFSKKNGSQVPADPIENGLLNLLFNPQFRYRESTRTIYEWKENRKASEEQRLAERTQ